MMKITFSPATIRFLLVLILSSAGLLMGACKKDAVLSDEETIKQYLSNNGVTTAQRQASGLYYVPVTTNIGGTKAVAGKTVSVLYTGALMNGTVFDASSKHGNTPFSFVLGQGQVIQGWDEGIALMRKGEKATLLIPSALGYGAQGAGSSIPANAVLRFEVELTDVK